MNTWSSEDKALFDHIIEEIAPDIAKASPPNADPLEIGKRVVDIARGIVEMKRAILRGDDVDKATDEFGYDDLTVSEH